MTSYEPDRNASDVLVVRKEHNAGRILRLLIAAVIVAVVVVMGLDNRQKVRVGYPSGHVNVAMWIVLVGAAIAGVIIGWLIKHRPHHHTA